MPQPLVEVYNFTASQSVASAATPRMVGMGMQRAYGDVLTDVLGTARPVFGTEPWGGPDPLPFIHFLAPGVYSISGCCYMTGNPANIGINFVDATGAPLTDADVRDPTTIQAGLLTGQLGDPRLGAGVTAAPFSSTVRVMTANVYMRIVGGQPGATGGTVHPTIPGSLAIAKFG